MGAVNGRRAIYLLLTIGFASVTPGSVEAWQDNGYTNLHVLPADVSRAELGRVMLENTRSLGLPRRAGEGCLHCHVGSLDLPREEWDYASDEKPAKEQARVMMAMVREINDGHLARLSGRQSVEVGCATCHAGRLNPMPLVDLLLAEHRDGGVESLESAYRTARARYYESDAYDFRVGTLAGVATQLAGAGRPEDAVRVHRMNIEYHESPEAHAGLMRLRLEQAFRSGGADALVSRYDALRDEHPPEAFQPGVLDVLGWGLFRSGNKEVARTLFEMNLAEFPDAFPSHESLAYVLMDAGEVERALELARAWVREHPDHRSGAQLVTELERMAGAGR